MRSYIERAKDFIGQVFPYIQGLEDPWDVSDCIDHFNMVFNRKVSVQHGSARIALITSDYVIKYTWDFDEATTIGDGAVEVSIYSIAKKEGFDYLFAEITPFEYNGITFYIMPRISGVGKAKYCGAYRYMNEEERKFCDSIHLTDLHKNNFGFRNKKICIIDYAYILDDECWKNYMEDKAIYGWM